MEQLEPYLDALAGVANAFTIVASGLAIYLFATNRGKISAAIQLLLNYLRVQWFASPKKV